jgi:hypothetical protein
LDIDYIRCIHYFKIINEIVPSEADEILISWLIIDISIKAPPNIRSKLAIDVNIHPTLQILNEADLAVVD